MHRYQPAHFRELTVALSGFWLIFALFLLPQMWADAHSDAGCEERDEVRRRARPVETYTTPSYTDIAYGPGRQQTGVEVEVLIAVLRTRR